MVRGLGKDTSRRGKFADDKKKCPYYMGDRKCIVCDETCCDFRKEAYDSQVKPGDVYGNYWDEKKRKKKVK